MCEGKWWAIGWFKDSLSKINLPLVVIIEMLLFIFDVSKVNA